MTNAAGMRPTSVESTEHYTKRIAYTGANPIYVGRAAIGTASNAAAWQIQKITYDGDNPTVIEWAGGNETFTQVWDNRASLSYS